MSEIKINENTYRASNKDPTDGVSCVTSKAPDMMRSRQSIYDWADAT